MNDDLRFGGLYRWGMAAWAIVGIALVAWGIGRVLLLTRALFGILLVALIVVYLLAPVVRRMETSGLKRGLGLGLLYLGVLGALVVLGFLLVPLIGSQVETLAEQLPLYSERLVEAAQAVEGWVQARGIDFSFDAESIFAGDRDLSGVLRQAGAVLGGTLSFIVAMIAGPILAFYLLLDLPKLRKKLILIIPEDRRERLLQVARDMNRAVGSFVRGQLIVALVVGILSTVALMIIGVPSPVAIGALAGFSNLVPFIGPWVGGIIGGLVAWAGVGNVAAIWTGIAFIVIQQLESHIITPQIVGRAVRISPATAMVAILVGAVVAGIAGMLLAIPVVAATKAAMIRLWFPQLLVAEEVEPLADEDDAGKDPDAGKEQAQDAAGESARGGPPAKAADARRGPPGEESGETKREKTVRSRRG